MMAESLDARKHERKATFDVPLPIKRKDREVNTSSETTAEETKAVPAPISSTMSFSLLTKRGNRQQVGATLHTSHRTKADGHRHERWSCPPTRHLLLT